MFFVRLRAMFWTVVTIGAIIAAIVAMRFAGLYVGAATSDWDPLKYHPYTFGNFELRGDALVIDPPVDIYVVVDGGRYILGPGRHFEPRLNGTALVELWHASGEVYRYLVYWDGGRYRAILHTYTCSCSKN